MFEADSITKEFESGAGTLRVLNDTSLKLAAGQNLAIVGPSGCGKSTFLHIAGTLDQPTSGTITLNGQPLTGLSEKELAKLRNEHIGFVFQDHLLLPQLSAIENVLIPLMASGKITESHRERATMLLEQVGLANRQDHHPAKLSGGERQRIAVARALIQKPSLILADEPTGSLDDANAETIGDLLLQMQSTEDAILICVTHSQNLADRFSQRLRLERGVFVEASHE